MSSHSDHTNYVGKKYIDDRDQSTAQSDPSKEVRHTELPEGTRIIHPDDMVTMDFREDRLNLYVDDNDIVTKQRCG